ncbi:MAG: hypothetical protein J7K73_01850 [Nanoarchaeota archaeon]|nr:hypothetical protein [Nanoarchaeota archaeon]
MLNKKGFMFTPIVFIAIFLVVVVFSVYTSTMDKTTSENIHENSKIETGVNIIEKKQIDIISFAKVATYLCSEAFPYPCNETDLEGCVEENLTTHFGSANWGFNIYGTDEAKARLTLPKINSTNMTSNQVTVTLYLNKNLLRWC